jgi:hypothetical protein
LLRVLLYKLLSALRVLTALVNTSFGGCITVAVEDKMGVGKWERRGTLCRPAGVVKSVIFSINAIPIT